MKATLYGLTKNKNDIHVKSQLEKMLAQVSAEGAAVIDGANIAAESIYGKSIVAGSIEATQIKAGAITSDHITTNGIVADKIKTGVLRSTNGASWLNLNDGTFSYANGNFTFQNGKMVVRAHTIELGGEEVPTKSQTEQYTDTLGSTLQEQIDTSIKSTEVEYYSSTSSTSPVGGSWSTTAPAWQEGRFMWSRTKITPNKGSVIYKPNATGTNISGATGSSAKIVTVTPSAQLFWRNQENAVTPATITVDGSVQNTTISAWQYSVDGGSFTTTLPAGVTRSGNKVTLTGANITARTIAIKALDASGNTDTTTIAMVQDGAKGVGGSSGPKGENAIVGILTNESITVPASESGSVTSFTGATGTFEIYDGTTRKTGSGVTYSVSGTSSNITVSINATTGVYTVSAMTGGTSVLSGNATLQAVYNGVTIQKVLTVTKAMTGKTGATGGTGASGSNAKIVTLTSSAQIFAKNADGVVSPASITVEGTSQNTSITAWEYSVDGGAFSSTLPTGLSRTGNVVSITGSSVTAKSISLRAKDASGISDVLSIAVVQDGAKGLDGAKGATGADAYTVVLSNEAHTFAGNTSSAIASNVTVNVVAYKGATRIGATIGTISGAVEGMSTSIATNGTTTASFTVSVTTAMSATNGTLTIPITVDGKPFSKTFSFALALKGVDGANGSAGANAKVIIVNPSAQIFTKDANGNVTPSTITVDGTAQNVTISTWEYSIEGGAFSTSIPTGLTRSGNKVTITGSSMTAKNISVRASGGGVSDTTTIAMVQDGARGLTGGTGAKGDNSIVGYLTNESVTLGASSTGVVSSFATASGTFRVFDGITEVTTNSACVFNLSSSTGVTLTINSSGVYTVTAMSADTATAEFKAVYKGVTITKTMSLSKSRVGPQGPDGPQGPNGISSIVGFLTNESITLPASDKGVVPSSSFASATGTFNVYEGTVLKNAQADYSVVTQSSITVSITQSGVYTVSAMTTGASVLYGTATLRAVYNGVTIDKILTVTKALAGSQGPIGGTGPTGPDGKDATTYWINASTNAIKKDVTGVINPNTITFSGFSKTGTSNPVAYAGRFIIQTSTDGVSYTTAYTSSANQSSYTYTVPTTASFVKARYYLAGGTSILLDEQTVPVLVDAEGIDKKYEGQSLLDKTEILSGTEIYTDKADDAVVHVEIEGRSFPQQPTKNIFGSPIKGYVNAVTGEILTPDALNLVSDFIKIDKSKKYMYSIWTKTSTSMGNWTGLGLYRSDKTFIKRPTLMIDSDFNTEKNLSIELSQYFTTDTEYIRIGSRHLQNGRFQLEEGSVSTAYETPAPSPDYPIEIHSLNDFDVVSQKSEGGMIDGVEVGGRNLYPNTYDYYQSITFGGWQSYLHYIPIGESSSIQEGDVITWSGYLKSGNYELGLMLDYRTTSGGYVQRQSNFIPPNSEGKVYGTHTVPKGASYVRLAVRQSSGSAPTNTHLYKHLKIEKGNKATDWTPAPEDVVESENHQLIDKINILLSEPLRSVGDVKDRLFRDSDGLWKVERNVGDMLLKDLSISTSAPFGGSNSYHFGGSVAFIVDSGNKPRRHTYSEFKSSFLRDAGSNNNYNNTANAHTELVGTVARISGESQRVFIRVSESTIGAVEGDSTSTLISKFRGWVTENNVDLQYQLANPTIETLPQSYQDKLNNISTYAGNNYLYTIVDKTNILPEYVRDNLHPNMKATFKGGGWYIRDASVKKEELKRTGTVVINGGNITAGSIKDVENRNSISLDNGTFTLANGNIVYNGSTLEIKSGVSFSALDSAAQTKINNGDAAKTTLDSKASLWDAKLTDAQVAAKILADKAIIDTRATNQNPAWYFSNYPNQIVREFKNVSVMGVGAGTYGILTTDVPWSGSSGGSVKQTFRTNTEEFKRDGSSTAWSGWVNHDAMALGAKTLTDKWAFTGKTTINGGQIEADTITATQIAANTITATQIAANTITAAKIASRTITTDRIVANAITANEIAAGTITATEIKSRAITTDRIATNAITANEINVANLSALSANLGNVTAGTIKSTNGLIDINLNTGVVNLGQPLTINFKPVATKEDVDNLEVGGRNLLLNSAMERSGASIDDYIDYDLRKDIFIPLMGQSITISFDGKSDDGINQHTDIYFRDSSLGGSSLMKSDPFVLTNEYQRFSYTKILSDTLESYAPNNLQMRFRTNRFVSGGQSTNTGKISIKNIKIEKGNKATDWTEAPEDVEDRIGQKADAEATNAELEGIKSTLEGTVSVDDYEKKMNDYSTFMETVQTDANNAKTKSEELDILLNDPEKGIVTNLGDAYTKINSLEGYLSFDSKTNTLTLARTAKSSTKIMISDTSIDFMDGSDQVASITNQYLKIERGIFTSSVQVSKHIIKPDDDDPEHLVFTYLG